MDEIIYTTNIIKVGGSYGVIIPLPHMKALGLTLGKQVEFTMKKPRYTEMPKEILDIYRKHMKTVSTFTDEELNKCLQMKYYESIAKKEKKIVDKEDIMTFRKGMAIGTDEHFLDKYLVFVLAFSDKQSFQNVMNDLDPTKKWKELNIKI